MPATRLLRCWWLVPVAVFGVFVAGGCSTARGAAASDPGGWVVGHAPLCEASAAVRCPGRQGMVLVADDDVGDALFAFAPDREGRLRGQRTLELPGSRHPADIEALAVAGDRLLVVGSHGRNGRCERTPARSRIQVVSVAPGSRRLEPVAVIDTGVRWDAITASPDSCLELLFVAPPPDRAETVCAAIVEAERSARKGSCMPFDVEGATGVTATGGDRVWLGLRQPRADGRPVLLRLTPALDELKFDAVALLETDNRGVRALSSRDGWLWAILGPAAPGFDRSVLWRAPVERLEGGGLLAGEVVRDDLPPSTEGMVVDDAGVTVVVDGDAGTSDSGQCLSPSRQLRIRLP